jgi:hypothetical protein
MGLRGSQQHPNPHCHSELSESIKEMSLQVNRAVIVRWRVPLDGPGVNAIVRAKDAFDTRGLKNYGAVAGSE